MFVAKDNYNFVRKNPFDNLRVGEGEFEPWMSHLKTSEGTNQLIYKALNNFGTTNLICYITIFFCICKTIYIISHNFLSQENILSQEKKKTIIIF